jgi:hypothetical protein
MIRDDYSKKFFYAPSLERIFRVRVCYRLVSEQETTLGMLGLINESLKNIIRDPLRVTPYLTPFLRGLFKPILKEGMKLYVVIYVLKEKKKN